MTTIPLNFATNFGSEIGTLIVLILAIFDFIMKGITMYKAGGRKQVARFVCLFIFNTCGILPIIYLIINKNKQSS